MNGPVPFFTSNMKPSEGPSPRFVIRHGPPGASGSCDYSEHYLTYRATLPNSEPGSTLAAAIDTRLRIPSAEDAIFLVMCGSLTLEFRGPMRRLTGLEAFAPRKSWVAGTFGLPQVADCGSLCVEGGPWDDDRVTLLGNPSFGLSKGIARLVLAAGSTSPTYYEVGEGLIVGLETGRLREIFLSGVRGLGSNLVGQS